MLPVLRLNSEYTLKYSPLPLGVHLASPSGTPLGGWLYLTVYTLSCPNMDTVKYVPSSEA